MPRSPIRACKSSAAMATTRNSIWSVTIATRASRRWRPAARRCSAISSPICSGSRRNNHGEARDMAEQLGGNTVLVEFDQGIAWVTLNRPEKRNAMSPTLNKEMIEVLEALEIDERCGVLVLTGAGDAFTAGMDLKEFFRESDVKSPEAWGQIARQAQIWQMQRLKWFPKPTIAMVNGWCFGGGFNPMISCDIAIAAEEATFGLSEVNWGIIPAGNVLRSIASKLRDTDGLYYALTGD